MVHTELDSLGRERRQIRHLARCTAPECKSTRGRVEGSRGVSVSNDFVVMVAYRRRGLHLGTENDHL